MQTSQMSNYHSTTLDVLSTQCNAIIQSYRQFQGDREWNNHIREYIVPRITSLIETLPSYAKSGRESELCRTMKLISGYLMTASDEDAKSSEKKKKVKASKTILSKYLSHKLTKDPVRQCLVGTLKHLFSCGTCILLAQIMHFLTFDVEFFQNITIRSVYSGQHYKYFKQANTVPRGDIKGMQQYSLPLHEWHHSECC